MKSRSFASLMEAYERVISRPNPVNERFYNGLFTRYENPVLTRQHIPPFWMYDANPETNPYMMQRLPVNATMNSGAIKLNGKYCMVVRVEGQDRKSFFAVAESDKPTEGFRFRDYPIMLPDTCAEETNVYDMRLTQHEDGWIYGVFCSESKDPDNSDLSAAVAAAGIVRTKDLENWERLPNLKTLRSPQQRNVVLHPEFVEGKYAFYTRPMDDFIETGSGGGIGFGLCDDIMNPVIDEEKIISARKYHVITEAKNGAGATPIKCDKGWIHIAHGVRNTAAGLRYVLYAFMTDLNDPSKVIGEPSGMLLGPLGIPAAAIGSGLADLIGGYMLYVIPPVIIKGLVALVGWKLYRKGSWVSAVVAFVLAEAVMVLGYFVFECFTSGAPAAAAAILPNVMQGVAGVVLGLVCVAVTPRMEKMMKLRLVTYKGAARH